MTGSIITCGGLTYDCNPSIWANLTIQADPNIQGLGVLSGFIATTFITITTVAIAYISDSVPDKTVNEVDRLIQKSIQTAWRRLAQHVPFGHLPSAHRATRIKALQRFILTLSDQQLVTGYALILAAYSQRCSLMSWKYNSANLLAWYSALTHVITLIVLREYLHENRAMLWWRVIAMACMAIMLLSLNVSAWYVSWSKAPMMPVPCTWHLPVEHEVARWTDYVQGFGLFLFELCYYTYNFVGLATDRRQGTLGWIRYTYRRIRKKDTLPNRNVLFLEHLCRPTHSRDSEGIPKTRLSRVTHLLKTFGFVRAEFAESLFSELMLMYGLFAALTGAMCMMRWGNMRYWESLGLTVERSHDIMDFGQMVALFLIALPFLGLAEAYWGTFISFLCIAKHFSVLTQRRTDSRDKSSSIEDESYHPRPTLRGTDHKLAHTGGVTVTYEETRSGAATPPDQLSLSTPKHTSWTTTTLSRDYETQSKLFQHNTVVKIFTVMLIISYIIALAAASSFFLLEVLDVLPLGGCLALLLIGMLFGFIGGIPSFG